MNPPAATAPIRVLYVEDNELDRELVSTALAAEAGAFELILANDRASFEACVEGDDFDVVLTDFDILGYSGFEVFDVVAARHPDLPVLILTGSGNEETAVEAMKRGVTDYIVKTPTHIRRLPPAIRSAVEHQRHRYSLQLADAVFDGVAEGIMVTNASGAIVRVNDACTRITGYSADELIGQNPRLLRSDLHDGAFYSDMWAALAESGNWKGELWNRRKNGEVYPQWLTISRVDPAGGRASHYVGMFSDVSDTKASAERLEHLTHYDVLTDLPNREYFLQKLASLAGRARGGEPLLLMYIDVDRFKEINHSFGHLVADQILLSVGQRLRDASRRNDLLARIGSDEFVVVMSGGGESGPLVEAAERLRERVTEPVFVDGREIAMTLSGGLALFPDDAHDPQTLLTCAELALLAAKRDGGGACRRYDPELGRSGLGRGEAVEALRNAIRKDELVLHYQPQVSLHSGEIVGMEALVRWQHPQKGLLPPGQFIPLAEESGLIVPLGEWVLDTAIAQIRQWRDAGLPALRVAVNLSARHFRQVNLPETIEALLRVNDTGAELLEIELTESVMMHDAAETIRIIDRLKAIGVRLSLDDFGTGYSSLAYLSRFAIDMVKIDQSFVRDITTNPVNASIAVATIAMSHKLGKSVIAEGVETEGQMTFLRRHDCDEMQGYFFSRPVPAEQLAEMLRAGRKVSFGAADDDDLPCLLLVDDEANILNALKRLLRREGYRILAADSAAQGLELLASNRIDVIVSDQRMPEMTGTEFLSRVKDLYPQTVRMVLSGYSELASVTDAINRGAIYKYLSKPWNDEELKVEVRHAFRHHKERQA